MELKTLLEGLNPVLLARWNTKLVGGFSEPLYSPSSSDRPAEIRFARDSFRSALHELAHWCVAGEERRKQLDYGYWYRPDGRNVEEQMEFFRMEVFPQALEKAFASQCEVPFEVSCDNLGGVQFDSAEFMHKVDLKCLELEKNGFPPRAAELLGLMSSFT